MTAYHIIKNDQAKEPESFLKQVTEDNMDESYDIAIIATGSNDITSLDTKSSVITLHSKIVEQNKVLLDIADSLVSTYHVEVFLVQRPPRYDLQDQSGMLSKLSDTANGLLMSEVFLRDNIHVVKESRLACDGKMRVERYCDDGIHLTKRGLVTYNTNVINSIREVFGDLVKVVSDDETVDKDMDRRDSAGGNLRGGQPSRRIQERRQDQRQWPRHNDRDDRPLGPPYRGGRGYHGQRNQSDGFGQDRRQNQGNGTGSNRVPLGNNRNYRQ